MLLVREYPMPDNEVSRASEVRKYATGDQNLQTVFEATTQLCASLFETEVSLLSFIEDDLQIVKGATGLTSATISRSDSFCSHTILSNDVMVVLDAAEDLRFRRNPFVTGEPFVRFYAGAPLKTSAGFNIGALCIADSQPRVRYSSSSRGQLAQLAKLVSSRMDEIICGPADRAEPRHSVDLQGMISSYGKKPISVAIQNISARGAMVHVTEAVIPKGEEVVLSIATAAMVATVMWTRNGLMGLSFHRAIDEDALIAMRKNGRKTNKSKTYQQFASIDALSNMH
jgi:hypothetical protein